jgi:glucose-6-phosphate dehydrogenase assembly protein OpcA
MAHIMNESVDCPHTTLCKAIETDAIEKQLELLWQETRHTSHDLGMTRTSMSNLIIYCDNVQSMQKLDSGIPHLVQRHPARVIMVISSREPGEAIIAEIAVHYRGCDSGTQLCSEQVNLYFPYRDIKRVASLVRPLLIGDLPTALWWACAEPPALREQVFAVLAEMSEHVIYDSRGWPNPVQGVKAMSRWVIGRKQPVFNLSWRYLKAWRRIIAQVFNPAVIPDALDSIERIEINHTPHALPMSWLLTGWLAARLNWKVDKGKTLSRSEVSWGFKSPKRYINVLIKRQDNGAAQINNLKIGWTINKEKGYAFIEHSSDQRLRVIADKSTIPEAVFPFIKPSTEVMVAAQMAHREKDPVFEKAIGVAQKMAAALD